VNLFSNPKTRLLVTALQAAGPAGGEVRATVELAHPALIQRWPRLRDWVRANREKLRARAAILRFKSEWEERGQDERFLLDSGVQLERGRDLLADPGDVAVDDIRDFVELSIDKRQRSFDAERESEVPRRKRFPDADDTRRYKESQRSFERRAEELFRQNLRSECIIEHVELDDTSFHGRLNWNITGRVNVLLGRNGYGKTLLLRSLLALLQYDDQSALQTIGKGTATISIFRNGREESIRFFDEFFDEENAVGKLPMLAIPDTRFLDRSSTTLSSVSDESVVDGERADLARYGARHFLVERPYSGMIQSFLYSLCLDYFEESSSFKGEQFTLVRDVVRELTDQIFDFASVVREGPDRFTLYVRTEGNEDNPLPIQKCSQGTLSVIAMFGLIYNYLKSLQPGGISEIIKRRGIVVIDEVDAHLHPLWQQKIVALLRDRFPQVQFIVTAHNPIAIAGCLEDEVSVLRKLPSGGFSLFQFPNDFIGWLPEDIYRKVFDIESPDLSFTRLDALRPFKGRLRKEADDLVKKPNRTSDEERSLLALEEQLLSIEKVEKARTRRLTQEELERENKTLRDRLRSSGSDEVEREVNELRRALSAERRVRLRITIALAGVIVVAVALAIVIFVFFSQHKL
jgi:hypothetical protein